MQHCPMTIHRTISQQLRGTGLYFEAAIGKTLRGLALAMTLCLPAWTQAPASQPPSGSGQSATQAASGVAARVGEFWYEGLVVRDIEFPETAPATAKQLAGLIPQKVGETLTRDKVRQSIQAIHATGRFSDVQVEAERVGGGQVALVFRAQPNYFVGEIFVEGAPEPPAANQVVNASKLQLGEVFTREKVDRGLKSITQLMEQNGYYLSTVTDQEEPQTQTQQMNLRIRIAPGPHAKVGQITVTGQAGYSAGQIQDIAKMHTGDFVTVQRVTRALNRLRKKYLKQERLLSQVAITSRSFRPESNAVDYAVDIEPGPRVEIATEGFRISHAQLKRNVPVYEEHALDEDLLNEGRRNLLNYMQGRGYFDAKVTLQRTTVSADSLRVSYQIEAGERHKLAKIEIRGNNNFPTELLRSRMQILPAERFLSHGRYSQALLADDVRNLIANPYHANGFLDVKITPKIEDNYRGENNVLAVTLEIDEGVQTMVGSLQITGNETKLAAPFPELNIAPGQGFGYPKIGDDREIILNYYFNHGFPDATFEASAQRSADNPHLMNVAYTIHEGEQVLVGQVYVAGLENTRESIVQREIQTKPGDPLSQIEMLNTQKRLYDLGIFSQVDTALQNPGSNEKEKNVLVNVQEAKRYTFNYGLGLEFQTGQPVNGSNQTPLGNAGVSPRVSFGVTRLNFRGRNHTLSFKANVGRLQQRGLISYDAPRLFNSPSWRLTFTTFYDNTVDVTTFTSQRLEGSVQAEQIIGKASIMTYRFTYRRVKASDIQNTISPNQIPLLSQPTRVGIPSISYIRNKRNSDLEPTKGNYTTFDGGVASGYFGSETDFTRVLMQNSTYYALGRNRPADRKFVLARSTRIGVQTPFGSTLMPQPGADCNQPQRICLPLAERFFTGGGNSHRGFGLNQAGPRDPNTGFPLGGTALFLNSIELRTPPPTLPFFQDNISFAIFHDAGNVFTNSHDMFHNLLRWSQKDPQLCLQPGTAGQCNYSYISHAIGIGVRYKTPVGPVRFDFGYNLNPPAFPRCTVVPQANQPCPAASFDPQHVSHFGVFFSIGQTF